MLRPILLCTIGVVTLSPAPRMTAAQSAAAQSTAGVRVAMLPVDLFTRHALDPQASDTAQLRVADHTLREALEKQPTVSLADSAAVSAAAYSPAALAAADARPCNVIVACAREVGRQLGVPYVLMSKLSKTSNLIWVYSPQLIEVASGKILLDDSYELKGDPAAMVPAGMSNYAGRLGHWLGEHAEHP